MPTRRTRKRDAYRSTARASTRVAAITVTSSTSSAGAGVIVVSSGGIAVAPVPAHGALDGGLDRGGPVAELPLRLGAADVHAQPGHAHPLQGHDGLAPGE